MIIVGIESSCDETSVGVLKAGKIASNIIFSQDAIHGMYGGIVPELASRAHLQRIYPLFRNALEKASVSIDEIDAIGVTNSPGLRGCLLVGVAFAQGLGCNLEKPVFPVNHLQAHIAANFIEKDVKFPAIGLVISGGHTSLFLLDNPVSFSLLGRTLDDACGEAFDKTGRILNLPFPGGKNLEILARKGDDGRIRFPRPYLPGTLNFSFSGLKTSVFYYVRKNGLSNAPDIAAGFQRAVADVIVRKLDDALDKFRVKSILMGGGVIQNKYLRNRLSGHFKDKEIRIFFPEPKLCMDNGAKVAILTDFLIRAGCAPTTYKIEVFPTTRGSNLQT